MNKLPSEFRLAVSREIVDDQWELDAVMKIVEREINARERAAASSCPSVKRLSREPSTAATLMSTDTSTICAYCDQAHHSSQCRVVTDVKMRKGTLFPMSEKGSPQQDMPLICEMLQLPTATPQQHL